MGSTRCRSPRGRRPRAAIPLMASVFLAISGCGQPALPSMTTLRSTQADGHWAESVTIPGGQHYVTASQDAGWILSKPTDNRSLSMSRLGLIGGAVSTSLLNIAAECCIGPSLAADGSGHLWFTSQRLVRIDEQTGAFRSFDYPPPPRDADPAFVHNPAAGR